MTSTVELSCFFGLYFVCDHGLFRALCLCGPCLIHREAVWAHLLHARVFFLSFVWCVPVIP